MTEVAAQSEEVKSLYNVNLDRAGSKKEWCLLFMATKTYTIRSGFYEDPIETIYDFIIFKMFEDTLFIDYN